MNRIFALLLTLFALSSAHADELPWLTDLDAARAEAARTERPIFFNCYARWAGPSVLMDSVVLREPALASWIAEHFTPLRIDMQSPAGRALAERYGVDSYAYFLVLDKDEEVEHRISGGARSDEFRSKLEAALSPATSLRGTRQRVESGHATAADSAAYLRALRTAGDGTTFRAVGRDFALAQTPDRYLDPGYWPFAVLAMNYHSPHFRYLIEHKAAFVEAHGAQSVDNLMESTLAREVRPWAEGKIQPIAARSDLDSLLADIARCQLPDSAATLLLGSMALLRTEGRYADFLQLMDRRGHLLHRYPGVRSGLELTFNFPNMTQADSLALIDYLDRAVDRERKAAGGQVTRASQQLADMRDGLRATLAGHAATATAGVDFLACTLDEAFRRAATEGKLVFLDCQTVWCGPCRAMAKNVFSLPRVGDFMNSRYVALKMDMETGEGPDVGHRYEVKAYPTMLILDAEGHELHRIVGYRDASALIEELSNVNAPNS